MDKNLATQIATDSVGIRSGLVALLALDDRAHDGSSSRYAFEPQQRYNIHFRPF